MRVFEYHSSMGVHMPQIRCTGTPYQIGSQHGKAARQQVLRCIDFYADLFRQSAGKDWGQVRELAMEFESSIAKNWPTFLEEMQGIAQGAGVTLSDIIAINVRTEITFGLFSDGCTALSWRTPDHEDNQGASFLAQNWDWMEVQKENLIALTIAKTDKPTIKMITEAGLIGKIGFNEAGVGVCLNAIKAKGMDPSRIPCHLGLRMVLESRSCDEAVKVLERYGVASSCHMLVADAKGGVGLEWSSKDLRKIEMNALQQVFHTNHYLAKHEEGVVDTVWLKDSLARIKRIEELCKTLGESPSSQDVAQIFKDERGFPNSICRNGGDGTVTVFNIIMDLRGKRAKVTLGRPVDPEEYFELAF